MCVKMLHLIPDMVYNIIESYLLYSTGHLYGSLSLSYSNLYDEPKHYEQSQYQ